MALSVLGVRIVLVAIFVIAGAAKLVNLTGSRKAVVNFGVPSWLAIAGIVVAVLLLGSYFLLPGLLFPIWLLVLGIVGIRERPPA